MDKRNIQRVMSMAQIFYALLWAAAILIGSYLFKNNEYYSIVFGILVIGSSLHISLLSFVSSKLLKQESNTKFCWK